MSGNDDTQMVLNQLLAQLATNTTRDIDQLMALTARLRRACPNDSLVARILTYAHQRIQSHLSYTPQTTRSNTA